MYVNCKGSKVDFHLEAPMGLQKFFANRWVLVCENALVKISGSVANIIHIAQVKWKWTNHALLINELRLYFLWLDNLFQFLADEDQLRGKADLKTESNHLSSSHLCIKGCFFDLRMTLLHRRNVDGFKVLHSIAVSYRWMLLLLLLLLCF